jgi:hypothetical protein
MLKDKSLQKDMNPFEGFIVGILKSYSKSFLLPSYIDGIVPS